MAAGWRWSNHDFAGRKKGMLAVILTTRMAFLLGTNWFVLTVLKRTRHITQQTEAAQPFSQQEFD